MNDQVKLSQQRKNAEPRYRMCQVKAEKKRKQNNTNVAHRTEEVPRKNCKKIARK